MSKSRSPRSVPVNDNQFILQCESYRNILADALGITYPPSILKRRIELLDEKDKIKIAKLHKQLYSILEKIDNVIVDRAEKLNDPWQTSYVRTIKKSSKRARQNKNAK